MSEKTNTGGTHTRCDDVIKECQIDLVNDTSLTQKNLQSETLSMSNELR